ncbi:MAG TPA: type II secretion system protein GspK [Verrucomicrobiae bacterium]|jgi:DNA uptake protein ComE-like DNA-binding protein|nr:type II secretion system protein GspK [Verrucomicrobiae bacterium]
MNLRPNKAASIAGSEYGSVLIIVLWIIFGLISITLYFAHSMSFELHTADNRVAGMEAEQAIEGARRYITCVLSNVNAIGILPDPATYQNEAVPVGNAHFWLIGRGDDTQTPVTSPHFGLIDESSKINLNSASSNVLFNLPRMTPEVIANILAWRSTNTTTQSGGAESDTYQTLQPPYTAKNAPFETVDELRLVYGMDMDTLYGEDANLNGVLDPNENDGDALPPSDNMNGTLDPGLLEYCTVYSAEPATDSNGATRINVTSAINETTLKNMMITNGIAANRADQIIAASGVANTGTTFTSVLQFYYRSGMSVTEFPKIEGSLRGASLVGLINVNTASEAVLACLPGLTNGEAAQLVQYRQQNTNNISQTPSMVWVTQVLSQQDAVAAGPYLTGHSYQFMADVAALGHEGRGYRRTRFIFDTRQGIPIVLHRQDLSELGWALGKDVRDKWLLGKQKP